MNLHFSVPFSGCGTEAPTESVEVEVLDPFNDTVQFTSTFAPGVNGGPASATVTFMPKTQGYYHVAVTWLPAGGRDQRDLLVVHDRGAAPDRTLSRSCPSVFRMDSGLVLCGSFAVTEDGTSRSFAETFEDVVAEGDTAWAYLSTKGQLRELRAGPTTMEPVTDGGSLRLYSIGMLLPSQPGEVVAMNGSTVSLIREDAGTLSVIGTQPAPAGFQLPGASMVNGNLLYVATEVSNTSIEASGRDSRICSYELTANGLTAVDGGQGACARFTGEPVGAGREGFWTWSSQSKTLRLVAPNATDGGLVTLDSLSVPQDWALPTPTISFYRPQRPLFIDNFGSTFSTSTYVPRREGNRIVVDVFRNTLAPRAAQDDVFWTGDSSETELWWANP